MPSAATLHLQERQEAESSASETGGRLKSSLYLASGTIRTLMHSTAHVMSPFLLPEMVERVAGMLNYFMLYLTGPERKSLKARRYISTGAGISPACKCKVPRN